MDTNRSRRKLALHPALDSIAAGNCVLATELSRMTDVYESGAFEAAVFYAARILEAITAEALRKVGLTPASVVLANLDTLQQFDLVPPATRAWAHGLRRLGNDVRHLLRPIGSADADLAMMFVEKWLAWFFCEFPYGERLPTLTVEGGPLFESGQTALRQFVDHCGHPSAGATELAEELFSDEGALLHLSPAPAAVVAERLIEHQNHDAAQQLLDASRKWFPDDVRLCQLQGLKWSRCNELDAAIAILEPLNRRVPQDSETSGILAGTYKRRSAASEEPLRWLHKAHQAYDHGWKSSHNTNAYLGINAATVLLWLGREVESRELALQVRDLLRGRIEQLSRIIPDAMARMGYWDRVTLAESELLIGEIEVARREYLAAFSAFPEERDSIRVSKDQAGEILARMHKPEPIPNFWDANS